MPDILIRGMEMPDEQPVTLILDPSGRVWLPDIKSSKEYMASELPPHGDLIDADSLVDDLLFDVELARRALDDIYIVGQTREQIQFEKDCKQNCADYVKESPVIIPSERREGDA